MIKKIVLFCAVFLSYELSAQNDSIYSVPIHKGTFITNLSGRITSGSTDITDQSSTSEIVNNDYIFGTKSGYFVADKWVVGGNLFLQREAQQSDILKTSSEKFFIGPWLRYYFSVHDNTSIYAQFSPLYVKTFSSTFINDATLVEVNMESVGGGFGVEMGVGFNYYLSDKVAFNIGVDLIQSKYKGERKNYLLNTLNSETTKETFLSVSFGFEIYLQQFFF